MHKRRNLFYCVTPYTNLFENTGCNFTTKLGLKHLCTCMLILNHTRQVPTFCIFHIHKDNLCFSKIVNQIFSKAFELFLSLP